VRGAGTLERGLETTGHDRLHQIVEGVDLERLQRVAVVGGDEDDAWPARGRHAFEHFEPVHVGHAHVEQDEVRLVLEHRCDRRAPARRLAHHLETIDLGEAQAESVARRPLVVDDEHTDHRGSRSAGIRTRVT